MTTYEYLNLIASCGGLALICHGIRVMSKNADMRSVDSQRKHDEAMARHDEAMAALRELIDGQAESRMPCARSSSEPGNPPRPKRHSNLSKGMFPAGAHLPAFAVSCAALPALARKCPQESPAGRRGADPALASPPPPVAPGSRGLKFTEKARERPNKAH